MRKPVFQRDVALAIAAAGLAAIVAAVKLVDEGASQVLLMIFVVTALPLGAIWAFMAWTVARTEAALRRGDGVMGRWHVDAAAWTAFRALEAKLGKPADNDGNELALRQGASRKGIEIIVGREGLLIGDEVFRLPRRSTPEITLAGLRMEPGTPVCIELHLYYPPVPTRYGRSPARRGCSAFRWRRRRSRRRPASSATTTRAGPARPTSSTARATAATPRTSAPAAPAASRPTAIPRSANAAAARCSRGAGRAASAACWSCSGWRWRSASATCSGSWGRCS
jgi:hypothetical protein